MIGALDIATSGLTAQRLRMDTIAGNVANLHATRRADGEPGPYRRRYVTFEAGNPRAGRGAPGVHVAAVEEDDSPGRMSYEPGHPDAIRSGPRAGYVEYPNVVMSEEMVNAIEAARAYEANITVAEATKNMIASSLRLLA